MDINILIATGMAQADGNKYCMLEHIDEADGDKYSEGLVNGSGSAQHIFPDQSKRIRLTNRNILLAADIT
jgi:hypothetical protein